jgi:hypothetical protein
MLNINTLPVSEYKTSATFEEILPITWGIFSLLKGLLLERIDVGENYLILYNRTLKTGSEKD